MSQTAWPPSSADSAIAEVRTELLALDPDGSRMAAVFRRTFDQLYDGQHTGRYKLAQLFKTEKTHFGTLIEINLQRELKLEDGDVLDYKIANHEVDCKYSHSGGWMLPIESFDQIVLVTQADDKNSTWSAGLVRVTEANRRTGENRDRKTSLNTQGRDDISWIFKDSPMPPNALLSLPESEVEIIMTARSGQARVNELLRRATNRRLTRSIIATVAQQDDFMKRVRENGGARTALRPEGFLILGGDYDIQRATAEGLGCEVPQPGEVVSVRVVPATANSGVRIDHAWWRLAAEDEETTEPAPVIRH